MSPFASLFGKKKFRKRRYEQIASKIYAAGSICPESQELGIFAEFAIDGKKTWSSFQINLLDFRQGERMNSYYPNEHPNKAPSVVSLPNRWTKNRLE